MLIDIVIALIVLGLLYYLITLLPLPPPFPMLIQVVIILAVILWLLSVSGVLGGGSFCGGGVGHLRL